MKFVDEYRSAESIQKFCRAMSEIITRPWIIMEICGGQTHSIMKHGIQELLPPEVTLLHGPGCPVCVTPMEQIDHAIHIAGQPNVIFCSFGDMLRVPGSEKDLFSVKAAGGDVRIVLSPMEVIQIAKEFPEKEVVFFAIGFETTAPANAMVIFQARQENLKNLSFLVSQVIVPPAMRTILASPENRVQGFLAAGHVCTIMGTQEYEPLACEFNIPIVVTGFEPLDIVQGIYMCVRQLEEGRAEVENQYSRSVKKEGNLSARRVIEEVFQIVPRKWRGVGEIPQSGLGLRSSYSMFDASKRFPRETKNCEADSPCISGEVLMGIKKPTECPAFGVSCTPDSPLGATMVSSEGACAAYFHYKKVNL
ncbi:MAG: hydrogenase formation protein HypD [Nitrospina sp.]|jgi:hydrogenase expression/formation protein HypD|nr:hydrogenase formation protein HypD [Nitrospina sp.]MBT5633101.1 hydrogenase formation protein HypD [Nitrospina sp.]